MLQSDSVSVSLCMLWPKYLTIVYTIDKGNVLAPLFLRQPKYRLILRTAPRSFEWKWFFKELSVLPGKWLAMTDHLLPHSSCSLKSNFSYSSVSLSLTMVELK